MSARTSVCMSVCISAAPNGRIIVKSDVGEVKKTLLQTPNLVKIGQKYLALLVKTYVPLQCLQKYDVFCSPTTMLQFHVKNEQFYIVDDYNNTKEMYCYVSIGNSNTRESVIFLRYRYIAYIVLHNMTQRAATTTQAEIIMKVLKWMERRFKLF